MRLHVKDIHLKDKCPPETLNLLMIVALLSLFAGGIFYEGMSMRAPPRTAQLAYPSSLF